MQHFHIISPKRWKIEELKNLATSPGRYTYYLGLFVIRDELSRGNKNIG